jgi:hypothetical protein
MKVWAVGSGFLSGTDWNRLSGRAGVVTFKTWAVSGGQTVAFSMPAGADSSATWAAGQSNVGNTTVTFNGQTITAWRGSNTPNGGWATPADTIDKYSSTTWLQVSGGDGCVFGGIGGYGPSYGYDFGGGAVGGNSASACGNNVMTDVSGLKAALTLAGVNHTNNCTEPAPFGRGGRTTKFSGNYSAGLGGGSMWGPAGGPAVVIYFS